MWIRIRIRNTGCMNRKTVLEKVKLHTSQGGELQVVHLGERDNQGELVVLHVELEERAAAHNLEGGQDDPAHVHMGDEHVARHLADVAQEGEVQVLVLQPRQL